MELLRARERVSERERERERDSDCVIHAQAHTLANIQKEYYLHTHPYIFIRI